MLAGYIVFFLFALVMAVSVWFIFEKAGQKGWKAIIPVYNIYILLKITGKKSWWIFLFPIQVVNIVVLLIITSDLARSFGKRPVFAAGLFIFPFLFYPLLAFGKSRYSSPLIN
jgi:hypothetical protein